ncbi:iron complex transport system ATP-binding protein [Enterococcus sp. DIV1767]|uniref:ABC transporter ATP-binding protein n=1 Tax=Enterococcus sp. DIV1767 TaxID=2774670 RepID=UPI003D2FAEDB
MSDVLEGRGLSLGYQDKNVIQNIDVSFLEGKTSIIIGPNGCGKSTLLKGLGRILTLRQGKVFLFSKALTELSTKEIAQSLAFLPQGIETPSDTTVREIIELGRYPHQGVFRKISFEDEQIIENVLAQTELTALAHRQVDSLSGGQKQRVWIAMALAQKTPVILLDEPTTYLDMGHQLDILKLLDSLQQHLSLTVVMVLHDLNLAARFADIMLAMKDGKLIKQGSVTDIMQPILLRELFDIDATIVEDPINGRPICIHYD